MSFHVRHFQASTSRFRSTGYNSLESPKKENEVEKRKEQSERGVKRRKTCLGEQALDSALWKYLPGDVFEKVVAYMPFPGLWRCRALNKECKEFVFSQRFLEARACVKSWECLDEKTQHLLVFATIQGVILCSAYDAVANRWLRMPPMSGLDPRAKDCIAGDGGLLCFRDVNPQGLATLFIYNPKTSSCRELRLMHIGNSMAQHIWLLTHLVYNRFTSSYKLLILTKRASHHQHSPAHMEVYDSLTQTWTVDNNLSIIERKYKLTFTPQVGACCDNFFYFVAKEGILRNSVMGLVVYDIYEGVFREKLLYRCEPRCPNSKIEVQVMECKGTVYMVVREDDEKGTKGVSFCRLNPSKEQKIEDSVLFESFFTKWGFAFPNYRCVSVREGLGLLLLDPSFQVLADDLSEELKLPACPFQGLTGFVTSSSGQGMKPWPLYYATQNVVSVAHFQPNTSVKV